MPYIKFIDGPLSGQKKFFEKIRDSYKCDFFDQDKMHKLNDENFDKMNIIKTVIYKLYKFAKFNPENIKEKELHGYSDRNPFLNFEYTYSIEQNNKKAFESFKKLNEKS